MLRRSTKGAEEGKNREDVKDRGGGGATCYTIKNILHNKRSDTRSVERSTDRDDTYCHIAHDDPYPLTAYRSPGLLQEVSTLSGQRALPGRLARLCDHLLRTR